MKTGVVLVNWNSGPLTVECLRSLHGGTRVPELTVVVDNNSADGSAEAVARECPRVHLLRNAENRGFAAANNQGMEWLLGQGCDYVWILNNDTVVHRDCLLQLEAAAGRWPQAPGISGKIFYDAPRERVWYVGAFRHDWHANVVHCRELPPLDRETGAREVAFISGCCMFLPGWAWRKYGPFLEPFVAYCEDSEWCWRVTKAGGRFIIQPEAVIWHKLSASVGKNFGDGKKRPVTVRAQYLMVRNHFWTISIHGQGARRFRWFLVNVLIVCKNILIAALRGDLTMGKSYVKAMVVGLKGYPDQPKDAHD